MTEKPYTIMWRWRRDGMRDKTSPWAPVRDIETGKTLIGESAYDAVFLCGSAHGGGDVDYGYVQPSGKIRVPPRIRSGYGA
jgi:hypothetical protein